MRFLKSKVIEGGTRSQINGGKLGDSELKPRGTSHKDGYREVINMVKVIPKRELIERY